MPTASDFTARAQQQQLLGFLAGAGTATGGTYTFGIGMDKFMQLVNTNLLLIARKIILDVFARVIMRTPVDTGRARANWLFSVGSPAGGADQNSYDKSTPGTNPYGVGSSTSKTKVEAAVQAFSLGSVAYLANNISYISTLEYGLYHFDEFTPRTIGGFSRQAPAGMVRLTVAEYASIVSGAVRAIRP